MNRTDDMSSPAAGAPLLRVRGLEAGYRKGSPAVRDMSFQVGPGETVCLIGPNGAGKSTTIKAVLGLVAKSRGEVELPPHYAYIPESPALYDELTLWEHLEVVAMANGMGQRAFRRRAPALLERFGMADVRYSFPGGFSKGMRQKAMVLCAILVEPQLYLVDEPLGGLDPFAVKELLDWFGAEKRMGAGILITTHALDIAQRMGDRFVLINRGRKAAEGTLDELRRQAGSPDEELLDVFWKLMKE